jgi:pimeloyl-ACP methyl ester carboxylesterase
VLAQAGFHVLAPDQRGYGGSSRPESVDAYSIVALTGDLVGLIDEVGAERATVVGHDWGSIIAWHMPLLHPDRVAAVAGLSGPPIPRSRRPPIELWRKKFGANFFYILYFQQPGVADADLGNDPATTMRRILAAPSPRYEQQVALMSQPGPQGYVERLVEPAGLPDWLSQHDLDYYIEQFSRTGFTGALNWYRNFDRNWELTAKMAATRITVPALFLAGDGDPVLSFAATDRYEEVVSGPYRELIIKGAGHWIQQERPDEVNAALLQLLSQVRGT